MHATQEVSRILPEGKYEVKHLHLPLGKQRTLLQKNKDVAENVSAYESMLFDLELK